GRVLSGLRAAHPYEEIAYDIFSLENQHHNIGSGMIGELEKPLPVQEFLSLLKKVMKAEGIRYTIPNQTLISKV
ncbi:MAG TPA: Nif3-like dinuclear metal center hexameric protein, partial [Bacteroidia bacterium]|nr:Nif3-like dinuclear metal center hexameric protein [Bacteroidia bacterium]